MSEPEEPLFFATPAEFRDWLERHHEGERELWVGFHKKGSGLPSLTWPEAVDEALCFGWIDGIRKRIDERSYRIRFTPRRPRSSWSRVNLARVAELSREGRMRPAGLRAFEARVEERTGIYAYELREAARLDGALEERFRSDPEAWASFQSRPPGYRKTAIAWLMSARKEETRQRRLAKLIEDSRNGRTLPGLTRPGAGE